MRTQCAYVPIKYVLQFSVTFFASLFLLFFAGRQIPYCYFQFIRWVYSLSERETFLIVFNLETV